MKIIETETKKVVTDYDLLKNISIKIDGTIILAEYKGHFVSGDLWRLKNVTDKYHIESDVKTREEIEDKIKLNNKVIGNNGLFVGSFLTTFNTAFQWVLKDAIFDEKVKESGESEY